MIAFLGPNEAGKTTVLRALDWFSHGDGGLTESAKNKRDRPGDDTPVVRVRYWLDPADLAALSELGLAEPPKTFQMSRYTKGEVRSRVDPDARRDPAPFKVAASQLEAFELRFSEDLLRDASQASAENPPTVSAWLDKAREMIKDPNLAAWNDEWATDVDSLDGFLREIVPNVNGDTPDEEPAPRAPELADAIAEARRLLLAGDPDVAARNILRARVPEFTMFTENDRNLRSSYDLASDQIRSDPPKALDNLAWVAELDLEQLWAAIESNDVREARTIERRANERLKAKLGPRWSQKDLDVQFNVDGTKLEVLVYENAEDGADSPIEERSDGLRTFVALVAFLARHDFAEPPILLVDEAENHLHYDAQADLIEVLTNDVQATQVFYTTHSPGCLPRDLGTGIRLVAP